MFVATRGCDFFALTPPFRLDGAVQAMASSPVVADIGSSADAGGSGGGGGGNGETPDTVGVCGRSAASSAPPRVHASSPPSSSATPLPLMASSASTSEVERCVCVRTCGVLPWVSIKSIGATEESAEDHAEEERQEDTELLREAEVESRCRP